MRSFVGLLLLLFVSTIISAQTIEKNKEGQYRFIDTQQQWQKTNIVAVGGASQYIRYFDQAISNPGVPYLVKKREEIIKLKPMLKKLVKVREVKIVYDEVNETVSLIESKSYKEKRSSYILLFSLIAVILMIISNVNTFYRENVFAAGIAITLSIAVTFVITLIIVSFFTFLISLVAFCACISIILAAVFLARDEYLYYKIFSVVYYILMTIYFVLLFI